MCMSLRCWGIHYSVLHYSVLHYSVLHYPTKFCTVIYFPALSCNVTLSCTALLFPEQHDFTVNVLTIRASDVFGLSPATRGNVPERTKMTAKIQPSGQRRLRVTEDREKSVEARLFLIQLITERRGWGGKTILVSTHLPFRPPPPHSSHLPRTKEEGRR